MMATASAACMAPAQTITSMVRLETWRCRGCRRIIIEMEYFGNVMVHKCKCSMWNRLPDDAQNLRVEQRR